MTHGKARRLSVHYLYALALLAVACTSTKPQPTLGAATRELRSIAQRHDVKIREGHVSFTTDGFATISHAPLVGIEDYTDADFAAGVPIQVIAIASTEPINLPQGSYLVKARFQPGATEGQALFIGAGGEVAAQRKIVVRTQAETANLFPEVYSNPPDSIPVVTSTHVWVAAAAPPRLPYAHYGIDCAGWKPHRVIFTEAKW
jgi:hypothetical protein